MLTDKHGGNLNAASIKYGLAPADFIDFSANLNPLGPPAPLLRHLKTCLNRIDRYPDPRSETLRDALSKEHKLSPENLIITNGSAELFYLIFWALKPRRTLIPVPSFSDYFRAARAADVETVNPILRYENNFNLNEAEFFDLIRRGDLIILCSPHNPTGIIFSESFIHKLIDVVSHNGSWLLIDEAFIDFASDYQGHLQDVSDINNLIVSRSLTKILAVPGIRIGYAAAPGCVIRRLKAVQPPWSVNFLAQEAGMWFCDNHEFALQTVEFIAEEKLVFYQMLNRICGIEMFSSAANFFLLNISGTGYTSGRLTDALGRTGLLVRDCLDFIGLSQNFIRVAVKTRTQNIRLIEELQRLIK